MASLFISSTMIDIRCCTFALSWMVFRQFPNRQFPNRQFPNRQFPNRQFQNRQFPNRQFQNRQLSLSLSQGRKLRGDSGGRSPQNLRWGGRSKGVATVLKVGGPKKEIRPQLGATRFQKLRGTKFFLEFGGSEGDQMFEVGGTKMDQIIVGGGCWEGHNIQQGANVVRVSFYSFSSIIIIDLRKKVVAYTCRVSGAGTV